MTGPCIQTCLWIEDQAQDAAETYVSLLPGSKIIHSFPRRGDDGAFLAHLALLDHRDTFLNGGPTYRLSPVASIEVHSTRRPRSI